MGHSREPKQPPLEEPVTTPSGEAWITADAQDAFEKFDQATGSTAWSATRRLAWPLCALIIAAFCAGLWVAIIFAFRALVALM